MGEKKKNAITRYTNETPTGDVVHVLRPTTLGNFSDNVRTLLRLFFFVEIVLMPIQKNYDKKKMAAARSKTVRDCCVPNRFIEHVGSSSNFV